MPGTDFCQKKLLIHFQWFYKCQYHYALWDYFIQKSTQNCVNLHRKMLLPCRKLDGLAW